MTDQTNKVKVNNKIGELNQTIAFNMSIRVKALGINMLL